MDQVQITLKGESFRDVINQARDLVTEADKFAGPTATTTTGTKKRGRPATKAAEVDETEETDLLEESETDSDEGVELSEENEELSFDSTEDEVPAKTLKKKTAKITDKDVNAAAIKYARTHGRPAVMKILEKKFKVKSILELKPEQYGAVIAALKA